MSQRAESKAYSWWWASHLRTKQSKWLEENLLGMEDMVKETLKIIQNDGDSFIQRVEMYYKKRPELVNLVEEAFREYRELAERYDHISKQLQSANHTIATVCPDQVQYHMDEDDEESKSGIPFSSSDDNKEMPAPPNKFLDVSKKELRTPSMSISRKGRPSKETASSTVVSCSGLSKTEALEEIDKLQKEILPLQTENEFVKSVYERAHEKFREIESRITEMQERIYSLQDEFGIGTVIEDDEARTLMATAAPRSCQETLYKLQEKQAHLSKEGQVDYQRLKQTREKFEMLRDEFISKHMNNQEFEDWKISDSTESTIHNGSREEEKQDPKLLPEKIDSNSLIVTEMAEKIDVLLNKVSALETTSSSQVKPLPEKIESKGPVIVTEMAEKIDVLVNKVIALETTSSSQVNPLPEKIESKGPMIVTEMAEKIDVLVNKVIALETTSYSQVNPLPEKTDSNSSLIVTEMAEKIDVLMNKVIALETASSSQTALVDRLKSETNELHSKRMSLEADKELIIEDAVQMKIKIRDLKEELQGVKNLNQTVRNQNNNLQAEFNDFISRLEDLSERVQNVKSDEEDETGTFKKRIPKEKEQIYELPQHGDAESLKDDDTAKKQKECDGGAQAMSLALEKEENASDLGKTQNFTHDEVHEGLDESVGSPDMEIHALGAGEAPLYRNGLDDREKTLLEEYTSFLRNYKEVRVKLKEVERENRINIFELSSQVREFTSALEARDNEIEFLHQKLNISGNCPNEGNRKITDEAANSQESANVVQKAFAEQNVDSKEETGSSNKSIEKSPRRKGSEKNPHVLSPLERKLREDIDDLLEENLEFWLRFSTSVHQIEKFETSMLDLRAKILKVREKIRRGRSKQLTVQSEVRPIYRHLTEIQTELSLWLEHNSVLDDELKGRLLTLNNIQYEIACHSNGSTLEDKAELSDHRAAKFQGEVLNMKEENKKIAEELHTGLGHVKELNAEVNDVLTKLEEEFGMNSQSQIRNSSNRVPLRSLLFGVKLKRKAVSKS